MGSPKSFFKELSSRWEERALFYKRALAHPLRVASVAPSSPDLAKLIARSLPGGEEGFCIELGAGTGAVTKQLDKRVPQEKLILVEWDAPLCDLLRKNYPRARVYSRDAGEFPGILEELDISSQEVSAIVSGIPIKSLTAREKDAYLEKCLASLRPGGVLVQYSFSSKPPVKPRDGRVRVTHEGASYRSFPPLHVWKYSAGG